MGYSLIVALAPADPVSSYALISSLVRASELLDFDRLVVVSTGALPGSLKAFLEEAGGGLFRDWGVVEVPRDDSGEEAPGYDPMLKRALDAVRREIEHRDSIVLVSPGSRKLVAALSIAAGYWHGAKRGERVCDIAHVDFYFGAWTGLYYPLTPRWVERLSFMLNVVRTEGLRSVVARIGGLVERGEDGWCREKYLGARLPPLRCSVALTTMAINSLALKPSDAASNASGGGDCSVLKVRVETAEGPLSNSARLCDPGSILKLAEWISGLVARELGESRDRIAAFAGAKLLGGVRDTGGGIVVDTNLVYSGIHNYSWEGYRIHVPECSIAEIERRLAEALKQVGARQARLSDGGSRRPIIDVLAWLALKDLEGSRAPVMPTPPGPCDTAIPKAESALLVDKTLVTMDQGAYRFWKIYATPRGYRVELAWLGEAPNPSTPMGASRAYYSLIQLLVVLKLLERFGVFDRLEAYVEGKRVAIEDDPLARALALH